MPKKRRVYPACGPQPTLRCLESHVGRDISHAKTCKHVKKAQRRAQFLVSLGRFGKLPFGAQQAKKANERLQGKACVKQGQVCRKLTKKCRT